MLTQSPFRTKGRHGQKFISIQEFHAEPTTISTIREQKATAGRERTRKKGEGGTASCGFRKDSGRESVCMREMKGGLRRVGREESTRSGREERTGRGYDEGK